MLDTAKVPPLGSTSFALFATPLLGVFLPYHDFVLRALCPTFGSANAAVHLSTTRTTR